MAQGVVKELIDKYEEIRARKDRLTQEKTDAENEFKQVQVELAKAITEMGEDDAQHGGYVYSPRVADKYSFKSQEDLDALGVDKFEVLAENGFEDIIKPSVGWQSLNSAMKEAAESKDGIPEEVLEILNRYDDITISRTKKKSDKQDKLKAAFERREKNV